MRIARLGPAGQEVPVARHDGKTYDIRSLTSDVDGQFLAAGGIAAIRDSLSAAQLPELPDATSLRVGPPLARPGKIICVGLNYLDHVKETNSSRPVEPVIFMKDPRTMIGPYDDVAIPRGSSKTDWEAELGVVIGLTARYLRNPSEAIAHIAGYAISHDVSEREFQLERGGQWVKGKSCETFNPFGPYLVPQEEIPDPQALKILLRVNGLVRQRSNTSLMIFSVAHLVWYISQFMVLYPGDVINTGTPAGVALGIPGQPYLRHGDVVEIEIEGLGRSRQRFVAESSNETLVPSHGALGANDVK